MQLFAGALISYLRDLCLLAHSRLLVKTLKINSFCLIVVEMKIFVYKIAKDSFWLLQIFIVIFHESV
jgi:hypothetical protein